MGRSIVRQLLLLSIIFYSGLSFMWIMPGAINKHIIEESLVLSFITLLVYVSRPIQSFRLKRQFFSISNLLVLSVFIVHFAQYLNFCINGSNVSFLLPNYANIASRISVCAFASLIFGLISPVNISKCLCEKKHCDVSRIMPFFFIFSIVIFVFFTGREYFTAGGNSAVLNGKGMNPIGAVGNVGCIAIVVASVVNAVQIYTNEKLSIVQYVKCFSPLFWLCVLIYISLVFISGDRGPIIDVLLVLFVGLLNLCKKKVAYVPAFVILFIGSIVLTIMSFFRGNDMELSLAKVHVIYYRFLFFVEETDFAFDLVKELSVVVNTFHLILGYINDYGIIYGKGIVFQLFAFFPGIRSAISTILALDIRTLSTDTLATLLLNEGIGAGTTCISDTYYNLGLVGTAIFFVLFGLFIAMLDKVMYEKKCKTIYLILAFCFMARAIYIGRSTALQPINLVVYASLYLYIARRFLISITNKKIVR